MKIFNLDKIVNLCYNKLYINYKGVCFRMTNKIMCVDIESN